MYQPFVHPFKNIEKNGASVAVPTAHREADSWNSEEACSIILKISFLSLRYQGRRIFL